MKLTLEKALDYYQAFVRLDGYARAVVTAQGTQVVVDSYDLSPTVKWRCIVNRELLGAIKAKFNDEQKKEQKSYDDFEASLDPKVEDKERDIMLKGFKHACDSRLATMALVEHEIAGLVKLPGEGIRIRARDPHIIGILALLKNDFLDGEPDYGQEKKPAKEKEAASA